MATDQKGILRFRVGNEVGPVEFRDDVGADLAAALDVPPGSERELTRADLDRLDAAKAGVGEEARRDIDALRREVELAGRVTMFWK